MLTQVTPLVLVPSDKLHHVLANPNGGQRDCVSTADAGRSQEQPSPADAASPPAALRADHDLAQMSLTSDEGALTTGDGPGLSRLALLEEPTLRNVDQEIRHLALLSE